jgi:hypothetical protein
MPKVKPGQSRKGENKAHTTTTQRGQSPSTGLSAEAVQALIDKIAKEYDINQSNLSKYKSGKLALSETHAWLFAGNYQ